MNVLGPLKHWDDAFIPRIRTVTKAPRVTGRYRVWPPQVYFGGGGLPEGRYRKSIPFAYHSTGLGREHGKQLGWRNGMGGRGNGTGSWSGSGRGRTIDRERSRDMAGTHSPEWLWIPSGMWAGDNGWRDKNDGDCYLLLATSCVVYVCSAWADEADPQAPSTSATSMVESWAQDVSITNNSQQLTYAQVPPPPHPYLKIKL